MKNELKWNEAEEFVFRRRMSRSVWSRELWAVVVGLWATRSFVDQLSWNERYVPQNVQNKTEQTSVYKQNSFIIRIEEASFTFWQTIMPNRF